MASFIYKKLFGFNRIIFQFLFLVFCGSTTYTGGFLAGTLVKVPDGYRSIEKLAVGDAVYCYDKQNNLVTSKITHISVKEHSKYSKILIDKFTIDAALNQQFFLVPPFKWIKTQNIKPGDQILMKSNYNLLVKDISLYADKVNMYDIGVAHYHNFCVTLLDICSHNFMPIAIGLSWAFGSGAIEFLGLSLSACILGAVLGFTHKKNTIDGCYGLSLDGSDASGTINLQRAPGWVCAAEEMGRQDS